MQLPSRRTGANLIDNHGRKFWGAYHSSTDCQLVHEFARDFSETSSNVDSIIWSVLSETLTTVALLEDDLTIIDEILVMLPDVLDTLLDKLGNVLDPINKAAVHHFRHTGC